MKKVLITISLLAGIGMIYANVDGNGKKKSKKCCSSSKCCSKAKADSTQQKGTEQK